MRTRRLALALALTCSFSVWAKPPRLTVLVSVDSLSADLLARNRTKFKSGFSQLITQGAYFPDVRYPYAQTVTAAGHTTLATGTTPWRHGIIANALVNRSTGKTSPVFADASHPVLEVPPSDEDSSPANLYAETLADRLRLATRGQAKVVAISGKARAAIPFAGRLGQAYWFHDSVGKFVTGTFYAKELPAWVKAFNEKKLADGYFGKEWALSQPAKEYAGEDDRAFEADWLGLGRTFPHKLTGGLPSVGKQFYSALGATPVASDLLVQFAKAALESEGMGKDEVPDLLAISFSAPDKTNHLFGPTSLEAQDTLIRLDKQLGEVIAAAEKAAGKGNVLVVLSADHGGPFAPEEWAQAGMPAQRVKPEQLRATLNRDLKAKLGVDKLAVGIEDTNLYLNPQLIADRKLDPVQVRRAAAAALAEQPDVLLAVAKDDLYGADPLRGYQLPLELSYYPDRSGDVLFALKPFRVQTEEGAGTNHGSPHGYDALVPLLMYGKGIKPGVYPEEIAPTDIAPTMAALLEMAPPAQAEGKVRTQALAR